MSQTIPDAEASTLISYLDAQREHALGILDGLDEDALRRQVLPSGWSSLGLVQHLALDVERFWFGAVVAGDGDVIESLADTSNAWQVSPDQTAASIFDRYRHEIERSNAIISATPMDSAPAWWPTHLFGDFRLETVREIVMHVMTETACHAGHLDAVRELIDGRLWLVLDE
ncbi:DinB family protein [soil metagenome]